MIISTYNSKDPPNPAYSFFILSKGLNSGRPMSRPCANCFIVKAVNVQDRERFYSYAYLLWKADKFSEFLVGSVIPFLRIDDYRKVFFDTLKNPILDHKNIKNVINQVITLKNKQTSLLKEIEIYKRLEDSIIRRYIKL